MISQPQMKSRGTTTWSGWRGTWWGYATSPVSQRVTLPGSSLWNNLPEREAACLLPTEAQGAAPSGQVQGQPLENVSVCRKGKLEADYSRIRRLVPSSLGLMQATLLQLFEINQRTLSVWHNDLLKWQERAVLSMDIPLPNPSLTSAASLPEPRQKEQEPAEPPSDLSPFTFSSPPDLSGQTVRRRQQAATTATLHPQPTPLPSASVPPAPLPAPPTPEPAIASPATPPGADSPGNLPRLKTRTTEWRCGRKIINQGLRIKVWTS
ncbi:uncharacterized protein [Paramormyrops kingsleyae]|uniref:uncharacterized protein n=1 Tax=Paramormyrops kingsleyae TaxID=1676925 RepID=UPI003B9780EC